MFVFGIEKVFNKARSVFVEVVYFVVNHVAVIVEIYVVSFKHIFVYHSLNHIIGRTNEVVSVGVFAVFTLFLRELQLVVHIFDRSESGVVDLYVQSLFFHFFLERFDNIERTPFAFVFRDILFGVVYIKFDYFVVVCFRRASANKYGTRNNKSKK